MTIAIDDNIKVHLASRRPFLFSVSWEEDRALRHLHRLASTYYPTTFTWTITKGLVAGKESLNEKYQG